MKPCPYCTEIIPIAAKKCRYCHEYLDEELREDRKQEAIALHRQWSPGLAGVLSFFIPGAGQIYKGQIGEGLGFLVVTVLGYVFFVIPGLIVHILCIVNAATAEKRSIEDTTKEKIEEHLPSLPELTEEEEKIAIRRQNKEALIILGVFAVLIGVALLAF